MLVVRTQSLRTVSGWLSRTPGGGSGDGGGFNRLIGSVDIHCSALSKVSANIVSTYKVL